jgi:hypothetical protein
MRFFVSLLWVGTPPQSVFVLIRLKQDDPIRTRYNHWKGCPLSTIRAGSVKNRIRIGRMPFLPWVYKVYELQKE